VELGHLPHRDYLVFMPKMIKSGHRCRDEGKCSEFGARDGPKEQAMGRCDMYGAYEERGALEVCGNWRLDFVFVSFVGRSARRDLWFVLCLSD
jgi:hypothetical protein